MREADAKLGAIIGDGPTGYHVAELLSRRQRDVAILGLPQTREWLGQRVPQSDFVPQNKVIDCVRALKASGAASAIFVGRFSLTTDRETVKRLFQKGAMWEPAIPLRVFRELLQQEGITLRNVLEILPELSIHANASSGDVDTEAAQRDLDAAASHASTQRLRESAQVFIVDEGKVLEHGDAHSTNATIMRFGESAARDTAKRPVLCKVASPHLLGLYPPVVGRTTADLCIANGIKGIIVEAGTTLVMDQGELMGLRSGSFFFCVRKKFVVDRQTEPCSLSA